MTGVKVKLSKAQVETLRKFKACYDAFPDYADRGWLSIHSLNRGSVRVLWNKGMVEARIVPRDSSVFRITQQGIDTLAEIGELKIEEKSK